MHFFTFSKFKNFHLIGPLDIVDILKILCAETMQWNKAPQIHTAWGECRSSKRWNEKERLRSNEDVWWSSKDNGTAPSQRIGPVINQEGDRDPNARADKHNHHLQSVTHNYQLHHVEWGCAVCTALSMKAFVHVFLDPTYLKIYMTILISLVLKTFLYPL